MAPSATLTLRPDAEGIAHAARLLGNGETVALPTETVYGLAADARNGAAVARVGATVGCGVTVLVLVLRERSIINASSSSTISATSAVPSAIRPGCGTDMPFFRTTPCANLRAVNVCAGE